MLDKTWWVLAFAMFDGIALQNDHTLVGLASWVSKVGIIHLWLLGKGHYPRAAAHSLDNSASNADRTSGVNFLNTLSFAQRQSSTIPLLWRFQQLVSWYISPCDRGLVFAANWGLEIMSTWAPGRHELMSPTNMTIKLAVSQ